ncbi:MAG TPA: benzoate-CoA ligase family protein [Sandaracinaceae bacterium LLY-WYZ-13_1]|nr:benzoate-CoA ligase family protein [Sandaracinaceae bacterium LLY-WYZ-13_1]
MSERDDYGFPPVFPERFNMADYFLDARVREGKGDRVAVKVGDRQWTYREVQAMADRCGHALRDRGIDLEDRVLILLYDGVEFAASFFGLLKAGAVFCMGNPLLKEADYDYLLDYTRAKAVVADAKTLAALGPALAKHPRCRVRWLVGEPEGEMPDGFERFDDALAEASSATDNADTHRDDVAGWLFTSGTTGKPKGAVHFHRDFPYNTECYPKRVLGIGEDDVFVSVSRLFFGYATGTNLMFPFAVGGTAVLFPDKPTPERIFEHVEAHGVTVLTNVPAMIRKMVDHEDADAHPMESLRMCLSAGEALPPALYERWRQRWGHCEILDGIGSAEMFHIYITNYPGDVKPGSLGKLVPGYDARVVGPGGEDVADGEMGRLWIKGDSKALCYWRDMEKSDGVFRGEWTVSADLFRREGEYFYYAGRGDDMLKVRGMFVSPLEIEGCLETHAAVKEAAVVGVDDGSGLIVPKAWVVLREGHEASDALVEALQQHAKTELARYKFPHRVGFLDALPRNDRGKIIRRELVERG